MSTIVVIAGSFEVDTFENGTKTPKPDQCVFVLTLVLLNPDIPCFANSVDPDQLASEEAN